MLKAPHEIYLIVKDYTYKDSYIEQFTTIFPHVMNILAFHTTASRSFKQRKITKT